MLFNRRPRVFFNVDDPAAATPPAAPTLDAPWAADAQAYFGDNADAIAGFDRFMREKQQPYITQLEEGSKDARELWADLQDEGKVVGTLRDLYASVFSEHPDLISAYDAIFTPPAEEATPVETPAAEGTPPALSDEDRALLEWARGKRDEETTTKAANDYQAFKEGLKESHSLTDADIAAMDVFIHVNPDNPDAAVAAYKQWRASVTGQPAEEVTEDAPAPPPVVGDGSTAATPPLATQYKEYSQIGDALKNYLATQGASATPPPVVG